MKNSDWRGKITHHSSDLKNQLATLAQNCKDKILAEVRQRATKAGEDMIKEMVHSEIDQLADDMALRLKDGYVQKVEEFNSNLHDILRIGFCMTHEEVFDFLKMSEESAYDFIVKELKSTFANAAPQSLLRKFNSVFKKDENGKLREWNAMKEEEIEQLYKNTKQSFEGKFEQFKRVFFPQGITKMGVEELKDDTVTPTMEDLLEDGEICAQPNPKRDSLRKSISISSIRILKDEEI